jgi:hypothetical protein
MQRLLTDPQIETRIWEIVHGPIDVQHRRQGNIATQLWKNATKETADYVEKNMLHAKSYANRSRLLEMALSKANVDGLYLEFGVQTGKSINFIAKHIEGIVHGFDSFEGLPEAWFDQFDKGTFSTNHQLPDVLENVQLHVGWFDKTLPEFAATHKGQVAFMHVDCDLYSSTKTIFDILGDRISSGTVIQADEYFNYPGWKHHEFKAFQEFVAQRKLKYEYLGYDRCNFSVALIIK